MNFDDVFRRAVAVLKADTYIFANGIKVIEGIQAQMEIEDIAANFEKTFQENQFTIVVEHPGTASVLSAEGHFTLLATQITLIVVENPSQRKLPGALNPLVVPFEIARSLYGQRATNNPVDRHFFEPSPKGFYLYLKGARGFLFSELKFQIPTELTPRTEPTGPTPQSIPIS